MRLFVGVRLTHQLESSLAGTIERLRQRAGTLAPRARIGWVPSERLHVTVRFVGELPKAQASAVEEAMREPIRVPRFDITIAGTGVFPSAGPPRVLWAGVTEGAEALRQVEDEVSARLETLGVPREGREYSPHLTLARFRQTDGLRAQALLEATRHETFGTMRVEETTLFESRLGAGGPAYFVRGCTPLVG